MDPSVGLRLRLGKMGEIGAYCEDQVENRPPLLKKVAWLPLPHAVVELIEVVLERSGDDWKRSVYGVHIAVKE